MYLLGKLANIYNNFGETILDLFILNIYWLLYTLLGGIIFGIIPATVSLYTCIRNKLRDKDYTRKRSTIFKETYKKEFFKSNKLLPVFLLWVILYIDYKLLSVINLGIFSILMQVIVLFFSVILVLVSLYIIPIYVNYNGTIREYLKKSLILIIGKPKESLFSLLLLLLTFSVYYTIPGIIPAFGITSYSFLSSRFILNDILPYKNVLG